MMEQQLRELKDVLKCESMARNKAESELKQLRAAVMESGVVSLSHKGDISSLQQEPEDVDARVATLEREVQELSAALVSETAALVAERKAKEMVLEEIGV